MNDATRELAAAGMKLPLAGFVLDLGSQQLRDARGEAVELRPQAWAVLRHLTLKAGRLASKDELLEAVWPGLVVTDGSLAQAISDIRAALKDAEHRVIKTVPKRGYMLVADATSSEAGRTAGAPRSNVPIAVDPLIGREADIAALLQWVAAHRLVTVLGAGGIGKTRLAQAVARERQGAHADGVWWVDLAALSAAEQIAPAIAMAADLQLGADDATGRLARALSSRDMLLVLDNCEHLAAHVAHDRAGDPRRRAGGVPARDVAGNAARARRAALPARDAFGAAARYGARRGAPPQCVAVARTASAGHRPSLRVARGDASARRSSLCRQLDGIPLAIEMAAARLPTLGIDAVRRLVAEKLLSNAIRGAPARQQTLQATLEWSHALLDAREQAVLRQLSVFAGSFGLDTAQRVVAVEGVTGVGRARRDPFAGRQVVAAGAAGDPPRYRLLETMRQFAAEQLDAAGETEAATQRHGRAMVERAQVMEREYWLNADAPWLARYKPDFDDLQAASDRAVVRQDADAVACLLLVLKRFDHLLGIGRRVASRQRWRFCRLPPRARERCCRWR